MNKVRVRTRSRSWKVGAVAALTMFVIGLSHADTAAAQATAGDLSQVVGELQEKLVQWYADRDALEARLDALEGDGRAFQDETVARIDQLRQQQTALQQSLTDQIKAMAQAVLYLEDNQIALQERLNNSIEELRLALDLLQQQVVGSADSLTNRVDALEKAGSVSAEQMDALSESLRRDIDSQMSASLVRERRLESRLNELQAAFDEYKASSDEKIQGLNNTNNILVGVSVLTLVLTFVNAGSP